MKRKITRKYIQCKEAYLDGFEEGFQRAYHLGEIRMTEEIQELRKEFIKKFGNADMFDDFYYELCRRLAEEVDKWLCRKDEE